MMPYTISELLKLQINSMSFLELEKNRCVHVRGNEILPRAEPHDRFSTPEGGALRSKLGEKNLNQGCRNEWIDF